jgi:hypothetical protein
VMLMDMAPTTAISEIPMNVVRVSLMTASPFWPHLTAQPRLR